MNIIIKLIYKALSKFIKYNFMDFEEEKKYLIFNKSYTYNDIDISQIGEDERKNFDFIKTWNDDTYLLHYTKTCYIDPTYGWIITKNNKILYHSVPSSYRHIIYNSKYGQTDKPDKILFLRKKKKIEIYDKIISLNELCGSFGKNYFFLWDALFGELALLKNNDININAMPILIPKSIAECSFFKETIKLSPIFNNIKFIYRDKNFIQCNEVYQCKVIHYRNTYLNTVLSWFSHIKPSKHTTKKIYLKRDEKSSRHIENNNEIEMIAQKYGFEIIDNNKLTVEEQIKLYRQVEYLIAIHGAGNINIIFRYPNNLSMLEIHTSTKIPASYAILSNQLGFKYDAVIGSELKGETNNNWANKSYFYLDPQKFEHKLKKILKITI